MSKLLNFSIFFFLVIFSLNTPAWANINVTAEEAKDLIDSTPDIIIVDVRPEEHYCDEGGHIPGAVNYPLTGYFQNNYTDFPIDATILVYCTWYVPSEQAASILDDAGYLNVYDMTVGMPNWPYETELCCVDDNDCDIGYVCVDDVCVEDPPPVFLSEPRWVGGVWPVLSADPANPHTATSENVVFFAFDDVKVDCQGVPMQKYWMYRPVEMLAGEVVPLGDGSWSYEVPGWSYMYWVLLEEPTIAETTGPGLFEFKLSVTDCHDQVTDSEEFFGQRYYFQVD